jgi:transposase
MAKRLPPEILEFFKRQGAKGGKIGGKRSLETMTPEQRSERARKAVAAREAGRAAAAPKKP